MAIQSFADEKTEKLFHGQSPKGIPTELIRIAYRKLAMINAAHALNDLKVPPKNNLHPLLRERRGQHAISVNDQFRICFRWLDGHAYDVEFTDYH